VTYANQLGSTCPDHRQATRASHKFVQQPTWPDTCGAQAPVQERYARGCPNRHHKRGPKYSLCFLSLSLSLSLSLFLSLPVSRWALLWFSLPPPPRVIYVLGERGWRWLVRAVQKVRRISARTRQNHTQPFILLLTMDNGFG